MVNFSPDFPLSNQQFLILHYIEPFLIFLIVIITVVEGRPYEWTKILTNEDLLNKFWSFWRSKVIVLNLFKVFWRNCLKSSRESISIKCFRKLSVWRKFDWKIRGQWFCCLVFDLKITFFACLDRFELKLIFLWNTQELILARLFFKYFADEFAFLKT